MPTIDSVPEHLRRSLDPEGTEIKDPSLLSVSKVANPAHLTPNRPKDEPKPTGPQPGASTATVDPTQALARVVEALTVRVAALEKQAGIRAGQQAPATGSLGA